MNNLKRSVSETLMPMQKGWSGVHGASRCVLEMTRSCVDDADEVVEVARFDVDGLMSEVNVDTIGAEDGGSAEVATESIFPAEAVSGRIL
ncbi:UNVERIFIED_CONTAM: hypothetical protein K2H54_007893 [Gekko kuhli]